MLKLLEVKILLITACVLTYFLGFIYLQHFLIEAAAPIPGDYTIILEGGTEIPMAAGFEGPIWVVILGSVLGSAWAFSGLSLFLLIPASVVALCMLLARFIEKALLRSSFYKRGEQS